MRTAGSSPDSMRRYTDQTLTCNRSATCEGLSSFCTVSLSLGTFAILTSR
jgi:hypothetical protein